jgi:hypothetical protein
MRGDLVEKEESREKSRRTQPGVSYTSERGYCVFIG